jgi:hypothetical protein
VSWASSDWYQLPAIEKEIEQSHEQENNQNWAMCWLAELQK